MRLMPVTNEAPNVRFQHRLQSSAVRTHGRTTVIRPQQHVCRKNWLRKIRVEHGHESVCSRQHRLHQPINFLCTDMDVRVAIRLCAFLCRSHAVARNGLKSSSAVPFPSNFTTSEREITIGISHVFPLARSYHTFPSLSASSQL